MCTLRDLKQLQLKKKNLVLSIKKQSFSSIILPLIKVVSCVRYVLHKSDKNIRFCAIPDKNLLIMSCLLYYII